MARTSWSAKGKTEKTGSSRDCRLLYKCCSNCSPRTVRKCCRSFRSSPVRSSYPSSNGLPPSWISFMVAILSIASRNMNKRLGRRQIWPLYNVTCPYRGSMIHNQMASTHLDMSQQDLPLYHLIQGLMITTLRLGPSMTPSS